MTLDDAVVQRLSKERSDADGELKKTQDSIVANSERLALLDGYEHKLAALRNDLKDTQDKAGEVKTDVATKQAELDALTSKVDEVRSRPIQLPAGHFTAGRDIPPGRYIVRGDSNFTIYDDRGELKTSVILGNGSYGSLTEYVCDLSDGDKLEDQGADSFQPMG